MVALCCKLLIHTVTAVHTGHQFLPNTLNDHYTPTTGKGAISAAFVRPSVCPSVAYIVNKRSK